MLTLLPDLDKNDATPLYVQLYEYLRQAVLTGDLADGEKLPSLRDLAETLGVSVTTIQQAYAQLSVEGYIRSRPQAGYFVSSGAAIPGEPAGNQSPKAANAMEGIAPAYLYDLDSFDYVKWKKCYNAVLNDYPEQLLFEGEAAGEAPLRREISRYVFESRGVRCDEDRVFIAAGTQQITANVCRLLRQAGIANVAVETPGYAPVRNIFRDRGFSLLDIPVREDGIAIEKLPVNLHAACYVCPSNQFPTGAVMPIGRRHELLKWAEANGSYIIEDDYDSELRYFGKPIPSLQGLDQSGRVIYLGSFSSTLFPAVKISYMVLPPKLADIFRRIVVDYTQSCSKVEQLALALFMERGHYRKGIGRLRRSCNAKLQQTLKAIASSDKGGDSMTITPRNTDSGISLLLEFTGDHLPTGSALLDEAAAAGVEGFLLRESADTRVIGIYYTRIPLKDAYDTIRGLVRRWRGMV